MAHRNVAAAGLIHIRARGRILTTAATAAALHSLSLPWGRRPSYKYNRTQCSSGTYFHFILQSCEIYLDLNTAAEIRVYCCALNYRVPKK